MNGGSTTIVIGVVGISISIIIAGDGGLHDFFHFLARSLALKGFVAGDFEEGFLFGLLFVEFVVVVITAAAIVVLLLLVLLNVIVARVGGRSGGAERAASTRSQKSCYGCSCSQRY